MVKGYVRVMKVWPFMVYTIIGCMAYGGLMVYVSNAPFLILEKGGMSGDTFAIIFAINSLGLMFGTYIINFMLKYMLHTTAICVKLNANKEELIWKRFFQSSYRCSESKAV